MSEDHYAVVTDGVVSNVVVWDGVSDWSPPEGSDLVALPYVEDEDGVRRYQGGIGWDYVDGQFVDNRPVEVIE